MKFFNEPWAPFVIIAAIIIVVSIIKLIIKNRKK